MNGEAPPPRGAATDQRQAQHNADRAEGLAMVRLHARRRAGHLLRCLQTAIEAGAWPRAAGLAERLYVIAMAGDLADAEQAGDGGRVHRLERSIRRRPAA